MRLSEKTVMVTGAGGFVGSAVIRRLLREGARVHALLRSAAPTSWEFADNPNVRVFRGDIAVKASVELALQDASYAVHTAMETRAGPRSQLRATAVEGSFNVYESAKAARIPRVVSISSFSVYMGCPDAPYDEDTPLRASGDPYGDAKLAAEKRLNEAVRDGGPELVLLRPPIIYGPGSRFWSTRFYELARQRGLMLPGGGHFLVSYVYIDNLVDAVIAGLTVPGSRGAFNIFDATMTYRDFVDPYLVDAGRSGRDVPLWLLRSGAAAIHAWQSLRTQWHPVSLPAFRFLTGGSGNCKPATKARRELQWETRIPFDQAMSITLEHLRGEAQVRSAGASS